MNTSLSTKQLQWRYATKKFDSEQKISEQKLDIIKESFNLTATSYGLQPIKLIVVSNKDIQESLVAQSWNQRQVADASHLLIFCIEKKLSAEYIKTYFERVKDIRNTPDEIIKPFQKFLIEDFEAKTIEDIQTWSTNQAYLAMGNLLTICALEEIDACPMEGIDIKVLDEEFGLREKGFTAITAISIGYRTESDFNTTDKTPKSRLPEDEIITVL